jgi:hypothetical protein
MTIPAKLQHGARFDTLLATWAWGVVRRRSRHGGGVSPAHSHRSPRPAAGPRPGGDDLPGGPPNRSCPVPELAREYFPQ